MFKVNKTKEKKQKETYKEDFVIVEGKKYTMEDMKHWFIQTRGFPSILFFGKGKNSIAGEGQSGGRYVSGIAKESETKFIEKYGKEEYIKRMDKLMGKTK